MRAGPLVAGGGGIVGILVLVLTLLGGGGSSGLDLGDPGSSDLSTECRTGADANQQEDCRIVGVVNSVQRHWSDQLDGYRQAKTVFFTGGTSTGCGSASSAVGPFYCPVDSTVYIDLGFYDELRQRFGATGGPFAEAYVIAHDSEHPLGQFTGG